MSRRTDVWSEPFRPSRAFRSEGRDLDLTASEDAAKLKRMFGADREPVCVAIASGDALTAVAGRTIRPHPGTAVHRLLARFAEGLTGAKRARPRSLDLALDAKSGRM